MYESSLTPHQLLDLLAAAPGRLLALTEGLTPAQLRTPPQPGEWSLTEVLAHLRACADVWGGYIDTLLTQDAPTFRAVNPTTYMKQTDYPRLEFHLSLQAFTTQREALLGVLRTAGAGGLFPLSHGDHRRQTLPAHGAHLHRMAGGA
jgi:hypothetical protein